MVRVMVRVRFRFRVANCCIQTAAEGDKMRINHVIKTDQWRCTPLIRPVPHFVVSILSGLRVDSVIGDITAPVDVLTNYASNLCRLKTQAATSLK